ncbi:MAG: hypothetical protein II077_03580, partial [Treponema sp.]|nr:hypothetical protein [Treponema sp.]
FFKYAKIPPWIFLSIEDLQANLRVAKPRLRALGILFQVRAALRGFFQGLQKRAALLHVANPPSMARQFFSSTRKSLLGFF